MPHMQHTRSIPSEDIAAAIDSLAETLARRFASHDSLMLAGIARGGVPFALKLAACISQKLGREIPAGTLNINFHRDDIGKNPIPRVCGPTELPGDVAGATVLLADDVIFSGRTSRAALNELFDLGRPAHVGLVALVDRGNRKLPIEPGFRGFILETDPSDHVNVTLDPANPANDRVEIVPDAS